MHFQYLPYYQRAGATVSMPLLLSDLLIEVDLIAYIGQPEVQPSATCRTHSSLWALLIRSGLWGQYLRYRSAAHCREAACSVGR